MKERRFATYLGAKLQEFQRYFNEYRTHAGLEGQLPDSGGGSVADKLCLVWLAEALSRVLPDADRRVIL